jgi:hypothetical protein
MELYGIWGATRNLPKENRLWDVFGDFSKVYSHRRQLSSSVVTAAGYRLDDRRVRVPVKIVMKLAQASNYDTNGGENLRHISDLGSWCVPFIFSFTWWRILKVRAVEHLLVSNHSVIFSRIYRHILLRLCCQHRTVLLLLLSKVKVVPFSRLNMHYARKTYGKMDI